MGQYVIEPRSIEDSHVLTFVTQKRFEGVNYVGSRLMPLRPYNGRKVKIKIRATDPAGIGQFKAANANTPTRMGGGTVTTTYMELVDLEEKEAISQEDLINMQSADGRIAELAVRNIVDVSAELAVRNMNLTEWMRWKALQDALTITYNDGVAVTIDYDLDNTDSAMSATHTPTVSTAWSNAGADIIGDIQGWSDTIEDDIGLPGTILWVNRATFRLMQANTAIKGYISTWGRQTTFVQAADLVELLDIDELVVYNGFWRDTDDTKTYFLPDGYVMLTCVPALPDGTSLGVMHNGPVVKVVGNDLVVQPAPEDEDLIDAEIYIHPESKTKNVRVSSARFPWFRRDGVIWADISP